MKTKTILSIAIMAALPFAAHADPVGPAAVPANGTAVVATANAPYVTQTPTAADATHIASTAYVKGAYNDAIAAVNKVANDVSGKQGKLMNMESTPHAISNNVVSSRIMPSSSEVWTNTSNADFAVYMDGVAEDVGDDLDNTLPTTFAVVKVMRSLGQEINSHSEAIASMDDTISNMQNDIGDVQTALDNKRVEIYTTWENDNAKQQVAFVNAQ